MARNSAHGWRVIPDDAIAISKAALVSQEPYKRDNTGKFVQGTGAGPGRPANTLKPLILAKLQSDEGPEFVASLWQQAKDGNTQAARLLLEYSIGKPAMAEEDREAAGKGADTLAVLLALVRAS